jgi:16S rRNA (guanine(966)-N(2))-methyltransferase RsmD
MRVIAGRWKGRSLEAPPGLATRPLPDRIKQSLFDWLGQDLDGWTVADVCAGSGGFGIEAASRGAAAVTLIEPGRHAWPALAANLAKLGGPAEVRLDRRPFQAALPVLHGLDLIFADPPFPWFTEQPELIAALSVAARAALAPTGRVLIRGEEGAALPAVEGLAECERRSYGRSWVAALVPS